MIQPIDLKNTGLGFCLLVLAAAVPALAEPPARSTVAKSSPSAPLLVRYKLSGGRCADGPCQSTYLIDRSGHIQFTDRSGKTVEKSMSQADLAALLEQINAADYPQIRSNRTDGECPSASDGQDASYTFYTNQGSQSISNCAIKIDPAAAPFARLQEILSRYLSEAQ
ncbi:hypothetical protein [Gloeobacter morelensis]|uniref:DUF4124 domain-containing protein n=1 Tax=Gloeobacter morelensis MG652769 TaxID=2781736 RepID=A0ABY3PLA8_9CYAN|nr:hypothetical protein [Gloeobacter morelensis]UFP94453.1 hypothetical protein ISF26_22365 [Gloeobacter morelensis MG652769]